MAKFYGAIGFAKTEETKPGVWEDVIVERSYSGDMPNTSFSFQSSDKVNDNLDVRNEISIVADIFAYQNFHSIRYVVFMGTKWKISSIKPEYPRMKLTVGGLYNGQ